MDRRDFERYYEWGSTERMVPALILIGVGALWLLSNLQIPFFLNWWKFWPAILIAVGVVKLVDSPFAAGRKSGAFLLIVGSIFLAGNLDLVRIGWDQLWPFLLIGAGVWMLIDRTGVWGPDNVEPARSSSSSKVRETAVFGGGKRKFAGREFTGGTFEAMFGGFEIDLRGAIMSADSAILDINAVFGGAEVRVPETWNVEVRGAGVFGAFTDNTNHPLPQTPGTKRLIVRGGAVFGGVNVKN